VTNLLSNAIEYNDEGGKVRVSTDGEEGVAIVKVFNTGPGIDAADLPHVFDRFHRGDKARTASGHSGLGLAIVQAIVHAHGGSIGVESDAETGTCFVAKFRAEEA